MLKHLLLACLAALAGYAGGAALGMFLVYAFSANRHDLDLEAAMTGFFVTGPLLALLCFIIALVLLRHRARRAAPGPDRRL
jgi:hypothetical protein